MYVHRNTIIFLLSIASAVEYVLGLSLNQAISNIDVELYTNK
jgi:hypothetical protein